MNDLVRSLDVGEEPEGSVELKERLTWDTHLVEGKRESLAAQMRYRLLSGNGEATYVVGVTDGGGVAGIPPEAFVETIEALEALAGDVGARVHGVQSWRTERGLVGTVSIVDVEADVLHDDHIVVGTAGHVDHGKSTLVGALVTGKNDDGDGALRSFLDVQPHEVERGLSADISFAVYGFEDGEPIHLDNPNRNADRADVVQNADRIVSFVDTVGHEPWLRTTIRGLVGQGIDYGLLTVAADDGPTKTTREHLGILLAMEIPTLVAITKVDMVEIGRASCRERVLRLV